MLHILCVSDVTDGPQTAVLDAGFQAATWLSDRVLAFHAIGPGFEAQRII